MGRRSLPAPAGRPDNPGTHVRPCRTTRGQAGGIPQRRDPGVIERSVRMAMIRRSGRVALVVLLAGGLMASACGGDDDSSDEGGQAADQFEFFSWWTGGGDSEGKQALLDLYADEYPDVKVVDSAIAGGAGTNAQAELANRLLADDPPDSYQRHAGKELLEDIDAGKVEDLTFLYEQEGWKDVFPAGLLDLLTVNGKIYSVPVNIHRSNVLWYNPAVLEQVGIAAPPTTW